MILADKIIKLRKQYTWSQEELAEKLNVSRQSVSKWESGNSIPDLNKIILMGELFGVSMDYLIKDEIEELEGAREDVEPGVTKISLEEAQSYVENKVFGANLISRGVLLCMLSVVPLFILLSLSKGERLFISEQMAIASGIALLLVTVAYGVSFFIRSIQYNVDVEKFEVENFELTYGVLNIFKEKAKNYRRFYVGRLSFGLGLIIVSALPLIILSILSYSEMIAIMSVAVLITIAGMGLYILIPAVIENGAYNCIIGEGEFSPNSKRSRKKVEKFAGIYWPLMVAIYLGWSFWTMDWHISWIIWPVAGVAFGAINGLFDFLDDGSNK